jgi:hypothetical protein
MEIACSVLPKFVSTSGYHASDLHQKYHPFPSAGARVHLPRPATNDSRTLASRSSQGAGMRSYLDLDSSSRPSWGTREPEPFGRCVNEDLRQTVAHTREVSMIAPHMVKARARQGLVQNIPTRGPCTCETCPVVTRSRVLSSGLNTSILSARYEES